MEQFFLESGISWTMSKILPFVIMLVLGGILFFISRKFAKKKWQRYVAFLLILVPAVIYFGLHPIYEGDFSNNYKSSATYAENGQIKQGKLTVITIPNCPFCYGSIQMLKQMVERVPGAEANIDFVVCSSDSSALEWYTEEIKGVFSAHLARETKSLVEIAGGSFPAFVYTDKNGKSRLWSNDSFGVMARDWVEDQFSGE